MKKKIISMLLVTSMALSLVACGSSKISTGSTSTTVKYSVVYPATGTQADGAKKLGELIAENSEERMKMQLYPSAQLGDKTSTMEGLKNGTIEMTECSATDMSTFNDMWSVFSLPYLWDNGKQAIETIMDPAVQKVLNADAEANGFVIIAWTDMGSRSILNTKKLVKTPDDLSGIKLRTMEDKLLSSSTNAMGAMSTPLAASEIYTGLQQKTIDGLDHTPAVIIANRWQEITKYFSVTEHFTIPDPVLVSKSWFDKLSAENQEAIMKAGKEFTDAWNNEIWPEATEAGLKAMEKEGVEITDVDKSLFKETVKPVVDDFMSNASDGQKELYNLLIETRKKY